MASLFKIVVLDDFQDNIRKLSCFSKLSCFKVKIYNNHIKGISQLSSRLADIDILILFQERTPITEALLERLPNLKIIAQIGDDTHTIDVKACQKRNIQLITASLCPISTAEFTWSLIMTTQRRIPQYISNLKNGAWQQSGLKAAHIPFNFNLGQRLFGKTLGLLGYNPVSALIADYAKAFQMQVFFWDENPQNKNILLAQGKQLSASKDDLFIKSDVLSVHLETKKEYIGYITEHDLCKMKKTALFVNTSSAAILKGNALSNALMQHRPGMVAIDVYESEPILQGYSLMRMENVICTPHIHFVEHHNYEQAFSLLFDQIIKYSQTYSSVLSSAK